MTTKTKPVWTDELFEEMSAAYTARMDELEESDRPKHSAEVVAELAETYGFTTNSFRMKLSQAGLYIKKDAGKASATSEAKASGAGRASKADAHSELIAALKDGGVADDEIDMTIVDKLTGKAALHLSALIRKITK
ncbi:MAG: hypothetical protein [Bacteriophage sp.]|nr:MAG: hypothetical protein [Bacteriophage sp.]